MRILAIETSCDETSVALVEASGGLSNPRFKIFKNLIASQVKIHAPFGGVVPNLAKREHLKNLPILFKKLQDTSYKIQDTDLIAVTVGPGLEPALWTGINFVKEVYEKIRGQRSEIKIIGASHLEGHLYSFLLNPKSQILNFKDLFPAVALIVSGGHTILLLMKNLTTYKKLGETRDDAAGEVFDKVARMLKLPYPGGPEIEKLAKQGNAEAIKFPRPMIDQKNYDFSFSGLKTAVLYYLRDNPLKTKDPQLKDDIAASLQKAVFDVLIKKTLRASNMFNAKSVIISGGVVSNKTLRGEFKKMIKTNKSKLNLLIPASKFCTDNAAMIAAAGYIDCLLNRRRRLIAKGNLALV